MLVHKKILVGTLVPALLQTLAIHDCYTCSVHTVMVFVLKEAMTDMSEVQFNGFVSFPFCVTDKIEQ